MGCQPKPWPATTRGTVPTTSYPKLLTLPANILCTPVTRSGEVLTPHVGPLSRPRYYSMPLHSTHDIPTSPTPLQCRAVFKGQPTAHFPLSKTPQDRFTPPIGPRLGILPHAAYPHPNSPSTMPIVETSSKPRRSIRIASQNLVEKRFSVQGMVLKSDPHTSARQSTNRLKTQLEDLVFVIPESVFEETRNVVPDLGESDPEKECDDERD
ncbi:hypothetical protein V5O48_005299 [Marasmius crinis-equi]|uniref:Uncharacterized protein n=1 Tax=Marasmius crinis-equi TaxID=585013 RepID=A0ABR3FML9_9AGAR